MVQVVDVRPSKHHSRSRSRHSVNDRVESHKHEHRSKTSSSRHRQSKYLDPFAYVPSYSTSSRPRSTSSTTPARPPGPPRAIVEDENVSLAKEVQTRRSALQHDDIVPNRGDIDQDPIILDVNSSDLAYFAGPSEVASTLSAPSEQDNGSTVSWKDEPMEPRGRQPSQPSLSVPSHVPEVLDTSRRNPSPYVFTPKAPQAVHTAYDSGYYSSPEAKFAKSSAPSSSSKAGKRLSEVMFSNKIGNADREERTAPSREDTATGSTEATDRKPARYSMRGLDLEENQRRTSPISMSPHASPSPLEKPSARSVHSTTRTRDRASSRPLPPSSYTPPSHSPSQQPRRRKESSSRSGHSSAQHSRSNSRATSPVSGRDPRLDESPRRSSTLPVGVAMGAALGAAAAYPSSRLATASFPPADYHSAPVVDMPAMPNMRGFAASGTSAPYPTDDATLMPSEHHYSPQVQQPGFVPPRLHSAETYPLSAAESRGYSHHRTGSTSQQFPGQLSIRQTRPLPPPQLGPCLRSRPGHHADWLSFVDSPYIYICPSCFDATVGTSVDLRNHVRTARPPAQPITCSFSSPWMRLALLLTDKNKDPRDSVLDLRRIYQVAHAEATAEACPGEYPAECRWYTLVHRGHRISGFPVCECDVAKVKALVPSVRDLWEESKSSRKRRYCALSTGSGRFADLMDELIRVDMIARSQGRRPDLSDLVDMVSDRKG